MDALFNAEKKSKPNFFEINNIVREMLIERSTDFRSEVLKCDGHVSERHNEDSAGLCVTLDWDDGMTGYRTWFYHGGVMICLGCDLKNRLPDNEDVIVSYAELCDSFSPSYEGEKLGDTEIVISDNRAVLNGKFAYYNLDISKPFRISNHVEDGKNRFAAYFVHGINPQGHSYAYAVTLNDDGQSPLNASDLPIALYVNRDGVQGVEFNDGTVIAVFHDNDESLNMQSSKLLNGEMADGILLVKDTE